MRKAWLANLVRISSASLDAAPPTPGRPALRAAAGLRGAGGAAERAQRWGSLRQKQALVGLFYLFVRSFSCLTFVSFACRGSEEEPWVGQPELPLYFLCLITALFAFHTPDVHFSLRMGNKMHSTLLEPALFCF